MKFSAIILVIITLGLTMFPCEDELFVSTVGETALTDRDHNGHEHEEGVDYCSPFCTCAISNTIEGSPMVSPDIQVIVSNPEFVYIIPVTIELINTVFQPPKV